MTLNEIREKYLSFYEKQGHSIIPSASLIPKDDPTTLFTGSGMQPLLPNLLGQPHPKGKMLVDSQKCFRAEDIDEVGDNRHTTFFEMLGNWSLGEYFKEKQLPWVFEFVTKEIGLDPNKLYVTVFAGDKEANIPRDNESVLIWKELFKSVGIEAKDVEMHSEVEAADKGMRGGRIFYYNASKNWWSRAGVPVNMPAGEPGGPDSELFYEFTEIKHDKAFGDNCHPNCDCGRFMEVCNSVFMEYLKKEDGSFEPLKQKNVDFGGGLERIAAAVNNNNDVFEIDVFSSIMTKIEEFTGKKYKASDELTTKSFRILADHLRAATFLLGDGVRPSNVMQGYVLRRLIRRAIRYAKLSDVFEQKICSKLAQNIIDIYKNDYPHLVSEKAKIISEIDIEEAKFEKVIENGLVRLKEIKAKGDKTLSGKEAFDLFTVEGFPFELTMEVAKEMGIEVDENINVDFMDLFEKHQEISRAGVQEKKFAGGLADKEDPQVVKYHTAAHLLLAGLRAVLGEEVHQKGANITAERLRFDFSYPEKMTDEQKKAVEDWVNDKIANKLDVKMVEIDLPTAKEKGAVGEFTSTYGDVVKVYCIGGDIDTPNIASKEICGGPHVENTTKLGHFRIKKEESSSAGVRRIKAILE